MDERVETNILFVRRQLKKLQPNVNYGHLTLLGQGAGLGLLLK